MGWKTRESDFGERRVTLRQSASDIVSLLLNPLQGEQKCRFRGKNAGSTYKIPTCTALAKIHHESTDKRGPEFGLIALQPRKHRKLRKNTYPCPSTLHPSHLLLRAGISSCIARSSLPVRKVALEQRTW